MLADERNLPDASIFQKSQHAAASPEAKLLQLAAHACRTDLYVTLLGRNDSVESDLATLLSLQYVQHPHQLVRHRLSQQ